MATNKINGKRYIGMTTRTLETRKYEHRTNAEKEKYANVVFLRAIRKYGFDAFEWEEIDNAILYDDLIEKEKYWIKYYDTFNNGYNQTMGGEGALGVVGEKSANAKITDRQAKEVLKLLFEGKKTINDISKITNINSEIIHSIN